METKKRTTRKMELLTAKVHSDDSLTLDTLMAHCDNERLEQVERRKIGFSK